MTELSNIAKVLLDKLPTFDPSWDKEKQVQWFSWVSDLRREFGRVDVVTNGDVAQDMGDLWAKEEIRREVAEYRVEGLEVYIARRHLADGLRRASVVLRQSEHLRLLGEAIDAAGLTVTFDGVPMSGPGATPKAKVDALFARLDAITAERDRLREVLGQAEESASALCEAVGFMDPDVCPVCAGEAAEDGDDYDHDHRDGCLLVFCDVVLDDARALLRGGE